MTDEDEKNKLQKNDIDKEFERFISQHFSPDLPNLFISLKRPNYKSTEIADLKRHFDWSLHPRRKDIDILLTSTINFRSATDTGYFKKSRDENLTHQDLLDILNDIAHALNRAIETRNGEDPDSASYVVLTDAINYCLKSVEKRLLELQKINDKVYEVYSKEENDLKGLLAE